MSNNKQTSVDIIYQGMSDKIVMQDLNKALICIHISHDDFLKLHKQAKAMHKEEGKNSYISGYLDNGYYEGAEEDASKLWEETYVFAHNETFGGNNEQH